MEILLTQGKVAQIDPEDWPLVSRYTWRAAKGGCPYSKYYVVASTYDPATQKTGKVYLHRLILAANPGEMVDHKSGDTFDNRRSNLRLCNDALNQQNSPARSGTSAFKGVAWHRKRRKWRVKFRWQGKDYWVGYFDEELEAAKAYDAAILQLAGEFAHLNVAA